MRWFCVFKNRKWKYNGKSIKRIFFIFSQKNLDNTKYYFHDQYVKGGGEGYFDFSGFFYFFRGKNLIEEKIEKSETSFNRKF